MIIILLLDLIMIVTVTVFIINFIFIQDTHVTEVFFSGVL